MNDAMEDKSKEKNEIAVFEFTEPSINVYDFQETMNENVTVKYQVLKMDGSVLIWIGTSNNPKFSDLSLSMNTRYDSLPISSKILGGASDAPSVNMSRRLAKKMNKPVYVSFNMPADKFVLADIEKRLLEEIKNKPDVF